MIAQKSAGGSLRLPEKSGFARNIFDGFGPANSLGTDVILGAEMGAHHKAPQWFRCSRIA
jgi:hypothetical protein